MAEPSRFSSAGSTTKLTYLSEFVAETGTTTAFARRTRALAQNLAALGIDVTLVTDEPGSTNVDARVRLNRLVTARRAARYKSNMGLRWVAAIWFLIALSIFLRRSKTEAILLSFHEPLHALFAVIVAKLRSTPTVMDVQDSWLVLEHEHRGRLRNALRKALEKRAMQAADAVCTVTPTLKAIVYSGYGLQPHKLHVVYNGADLPPNIGNHAKDIDVIHLGSPREYYGTLPVIEALGALDYPNQLGNLVFLGCTDEPYAIRVKARAQELGLASHVLFLPPVHTDEVGTWLDRAKIALHTFGPDPIYKCAIGIKIFEYLSHGLPVVHLGPSDGETARLVEEGPCGVVVESPHAVPSAIESLLRDERRRAALSGSARAVASRYTWRRAATALADIVRLVTVEGSREAGGP